MSAYLRLEAYDPLRSGVTLIDPLVPPGAFPTVLLEPDWGNAEWEAQMAGPRGTLGPVVTSQAPKTRTVTLPLRLIGASKQDLATRLSDLHAIVDLMRRYGGRITRRSHNQTYRQHLDVIHTGGVAVRAWGQGIEARDRAEVAITAVCAPYAEGDPMDIRDLFAADTESDYVADQGGGAGVVIGDGRASFPANVTTRNRMVHTALGYLYGDHMAAVSFVPNIAGTVTNTAAGVILKRRDATTRIEAYLVDNGASLDLKIDVSGVNRATANIAATRFSTAGKAPWVVVGWIDGNTVRARAFSRDGLTTAQASATYTLTQAEQGTGLGAHDVGNAGWLVEARDATHYLQWFRVVPYSYGLADVTADKVVAGVPITMEGAIPGDAPAKLRIVTRSQGKGVLIGWTRVPDTYNRVVQGHGETAISRWSVAAVTGVTGAATSVAQATGSARAKWGTGSIQTVTPATANTGASYRMEQHFRRGRVYVALLWASSAAQTTLTRVRLGVNGDIASETAKALTTTPTLRTVTWQPTADVTNATLAFEVTAATLTTMNADGVVVFESRPAYLSVAALSTDTTFTVRSVPQHWPQAPFLALLGAEVVLVKAIAGSAVTVARGQLDTTAAAASIGDMLHPLPPGKHLEGWGAFPPFGIIAGAENTFPISPGLATIGPPNSVFTQVSAGSTVGTGAKLSVRGDTSLLPDAGRDGAMNVEMWVRHQTPSTAVIPRIYGAEVCQAGPVEWGTQKVVVKPGVTEWRFSRVGTFRAQGGGRIDPLLGALNVSVSEAPLGAGTGEYRIDHAILVPTSSRVVTMTDQTDALTTGSGIIQPDGSVRRYGSWLEAADTEAGLTSSGLGGATLEANPGVQALVVKVSGGTPFQSSVTTAAADQLTEFDVQVIPTPRWAILRD